MGLLRAIGRLTPLVAAGAAAGWYLRRQGLLGGRPRPQLPWPPGPEPPAPTAAPPPEEERGLGPHADAVAAVSDAADVATVVEDLLTPAPGEQEQAPVTDEDLARAVRAAVTGPPAAPEGAIEVYVTEGTVWLRGQLERPETITEAERRAAAVPGVRDVRNLLHLPGTPPPTRG
jgi:BON domain